jgi:hypothetical protein
LKSGSVLRLIGRSMKCQSSKRARGSADPYLRTPERIGKRGGFGEGGAVVGGQHRLGLVRQVLPESLTISSSFALPSGVLESFVKGNAGDDLMPI